MGKVCGTIQPARNQAGAQAAPAKKTRPVARQQSTITKVYINLRWFHHFVPLLGLFIILMGIYLAMTDPENIIVGQTVIAGGALISFSAIYYNKTR